MKIMCYITYQGLVLFDQRRKRVGLKFTGRLVSGRLAPTAGGPGSVSGQGARTLHPLGAANTRQMYEQEG